MLFRKLGFARRKIKIVLFLQPGWDDFGGVSNAYFFSSLDGMTSAENQMRIFFPRLPDPVESRHSKIRAALQAHWAFIWCLRRPRFLHRCFWRFSGGLPFFFGGCPTSPLEGARPIESRHSKNRAVLQAHWVFIWCLGRQRFLHHCFRRFSGGLPFFIGGCPTSRLEEARPM